MHMHKWENEQWTKEYKIVSGYHHENEFFLVDRISGLSLPTGYNNPEDARRAAIELSIGCQIESFLNEE